MLRFAVSSQSAREAERTASKRHWRTLVVDSSRGRLDRRAYELAVAFETRSALRAGRLWVDGSRRHANQASYLLPEDRWQQIKPQFAQTIDRPLTATVRLDALAAEQAELVTALQAMSAETGIEIDGGELQVTSGDRDNDSSRLSELIAERLPKLELGELLVEVDGWTGFTADLAHASGASSRTANLPHVLFAAILAQATNLGLTGMADSSDLSYDQLAWATEWYLRHETLAAASGRLVDHHHGLPLASSWGDGRLSSSDGQRFATSAKGPAVAALPRYFGHRRRGAQFFTWTSDQYSQYASKVVPATVRDAAHVLDGILDNQTELEIAEHTTDTHGYTVMWTVGCVKGRRRHLSAGSIGSPSLSRRCARRAAVQRWRSTSRGQPRCSASSARRSSVSRRVRSLGA